MAVLGLNSLQDWAIFILYIVVSTNHAMLTTAAQDERKYKFNATSAVLLSEALKLATAIVIYITWNEGSIQNLFSEILKHRKVMMLYTVPAFLYASSNNLSFVNLSLHDPTTFIILMQFRIVISGVIYQILFDRKLSTPQWMSLVILTCGCVIKHMDFASLEEGETRSWLSFPFTIGLFFILLQSFMALFAGVYTEYLLKGKQDNVNLWTQNIFMYFHSVLWNLFFATIGSFFTDRFWDGSESIIQPKVLAIVANHVVFGIITSMFLKNLNSILKSFAIGIEMVLMPIAGAIFFGIQVNTATVAAIVIVIIAIQIYSWNPLVNQPTDTTSSTLGQGKERPGTK